MPKKIHFIFAAVLFALIGNQTTTVEAQYHLRSRQPFQAGFRWLGQGWSAGYHHQNPGPNSDYYNPYTAHNSMLISRMPQYQTGHHQYGNHSILPHSSFPNHSGSSWDQGPGQSIQPTFVPVDDVDEADNENDFKPADPPSVTADSEEPGSIHVDEDLDEDAGFEESSFGDQDAFDDIEAESFGSESKSSGSDTKSSGSESKSSGSDTKSSGSESKPSGSGTKSSIPESKPSGSHTKPSGSGSGSKASGSKTKASKTGFSREEPGSLKSLDFESFMVN